MAENSLNFSISQMLVQIDQTSNKFRIANLPVSIKIHVSYDLIDLTFWYFEPSFEYSVLHLFDQNNTSFISIDYVEFFTKFATKLIIADHLDEHFQHCFL